MTYPVKVPKKLIEVALPLAAINDASVRESFIYRGNPSSLHKWWAQRPLAAARAVICGQMINDPSWKWEIEHTGEIPPNHLKASWAASRKRLFDILEDLVKWESTTNEEVLQKAYAEIRKSWHETCDLNRDHPRAAELFNPNRLPILEDPFAGGGTIPLEAQRLGLETNASDLNPVAVLISKALIAIPPRFTGRPPVNPDWQHLPEGEKLLRQWHAAEGLANDVRYYGRWMRDEASRRVGHLYPEVWVTAEVANDRQDLQPLIGGKLTVIAWLWARTVKSPNPAFRHADVPLTSTFVLSNKDEKSAYVQPVIQGDRYSFTVKFGKPPAEATMGTKLARGANFRCILSGAAIEPSYIYSEANAGGMGSRLMAIACEGERGRVYLSPTPHDEAMAHSARPDWRPEISMPANPRWFSPPLYGLKTFGDLFTERQLVALTTFSDLVKEVAQKIRGDAVASGMSSDPKDSYPNAFSATAYSEGLTVYLAFIISKMTDYNCSLIPWYTKEDRPGHLFSKQAIPMVWDYAEVNPFADIGGGFTASCKIVADSLLGCPESSIPGHVIQSNAVSSNRDTSAIISTDPPYYDNIGYADLSDFFYVWLRRSLRHIFPDLFITIATPKSEELVATPYRHGNKDKAEAFFLEGMTRVMTRFAKQAHPGFPLTIYYAFKQSETKKDGGTTSTGWETFLDAINRAGLALCGTWPIRTERGSRSTGIGTNSLASSIVLVCRRRPDDAVAVSRRAFQRELYQILPEALDEMTRGSGAERSPVAPVDLSQAIIGPGMAVFSKYSAVLEADGTPMTVRTALQLINRFLAEDDFDHDTQFCLHWFEQHGWKDGRFGEADTLARAKGTSVDGVKQAGVLFAAGGVVRLLKWADYPNNWDPTTDTRLPVWEVLHQMIRIFKSEGESGAGAVLSGVQAKAEATRQLAYRLYTLCERAGWAEDARAYNEIVTSWSAIESSATKEPELKQTTLFGA